MCNAEWAAALRCIAEGKPLPERDAFVPRKSMGRKQKMHSVQCNWAWPGAVKGFRVSAAAERFQQNLCATLRSLRFDAATQLPRPSPPSPGSVLPPPMPDVLQYWRRSGKVEREKSGRDPGSPRAEGA